MAEFLGALFITYILTRAISYKARKWMNPTIAALIAFFGVATIALLIASFTMGIDKGIMLYAPCLLLWLIVDIVRSKRTPDKTDPSKHC